MLFGILQKGGKKSRFHTDMSKNPNVADSTLLQVFLEQLNLNNFKCEGGVQSISESSDGLSGNSRNHK